MFTPRSFHRLWARLIDAFVVALLSWPALGWDAITGAGPSHVRTPWALLVFILAVPILYEGLCFWFFGRTLGKWIYSLKVVPAHQADRSLTAVEAFSRALADQLIFFAGWSIFVVGFFRYDRRHLADFLAGTRVLADLRRPSPARLRWVWAFVFLAAFGTTSWQEARTILRSLSWDSQSVSFTLP